MVVGSNGALLSASQPGSEVVEGLAPLRWPYRSWAQQERALRAAAAAAHSETSPESSDASEDDEKREDGRWETIKEDTVESGDSTSSSISRAQTTPSYLTKIRWQNWRPNAYSPSQPAIPRPTCACEPPPLAS